MKMICFCNDTYKNMKKAFPFYEIGQNTSPLNKQKHKFACGSFIMIIHIDAQIIIENISE